MSVSQRRKREREQRRAQILEAAERVFHERGLAAATMEQVASEAELSKGALYLYFRSKDELFMGLASVVFDAAIEAMTPVAADESCSGLVTFRRLAQSYVEVALGHPETVRNVLIWFASGDMIDTESEGFLAYRARIEKVHKLIIGVLLRGQKDGSIRTELDPVTTMAQVWPSLMSSVVMTLNLPEIKRRIPKPVDGEQLTPGLIELLVRGIATPTELDS